MLVLSARCAKSSRSAAFPAALTVLLACLPLAALGAVDAAKVDLAAADDYQVTAASGAPAGAVYQAVNRAQGLTMRFADASVRFAPGPDDAPWAVGLTLAAYGALDGAQPVQAGTATLDGARIEQQVAAGLSMWRVNSADGLVQGFTLAGPVGSPNGDGLQLHQLELLVALDGVTARAANEQAIVFVTPGRRQVLRCSLAGAADADGAPVSVKFALADDPGGAGAVLRLTAVVPERDVRYPVDIRLKFDARDIASALTAPAATGDAQPLTAPASDLCTGALAIPAGPYPVLSATVDNTSATDTNDPIPLCQTSGHLGVWFTFTPTTTANYTVTTCAAQAPGTTRRDTVLAVFTSTAGCSGAFTQEVCNDDYSGCSTSNLQSRVVFTGNAGKTYYILAYAYGVTGGPIQLAIDQTLPPPANDTCAGAQVIPSGGPWPALTTPVNNAWATSAGDPDALCSLSETGGLWYSFTPATSGKYAITTCSHVAPANTRSDTVLGVFTSASACSGTYTQIDGGCNDNNLDCTGHPLQSLVEPQLTAGVTYYVVAYNYGFGASGDIQVAVAPLPAAPANDACSAGQSIPAAGPFPYLTTPVDITSAAVDGDPTAWSCLAEVNHVAWYAFTPSAAGVYSFTTCPAQAPGTTCLDTVLSVYTSSDNSCDGTLASVACNDNDSACSAAGLSTVTATLGAGVHYFVLVGAPGTSVPQPGGVQLRVDFVPAPANDSCASPIPLTLNVPLAGTTIGAADDYELSSTSPTCFTLPSSPAPIGQAVSTAPGRDVVYSFTPATSDAYSFRAFSYSLDQNLVLSVASDCPAATPGTPVTASSCVGASNRSSSSWQEEVLCAPLTAGQTYYVFVDDGVSNNPGSPFFVEVRPCTRETSSNDTPATATAFSCGVEGSIGVAGDVDYFSVTSGAAGSRLFAMADGGAAASTDFDMRVTTTTDTLQYDDSSLDVPFGSLAPTIDGVTLAAGPPVYIAITQYLTSGVSEPYRIYAVVEPSYDTAVSETEPNDSPAQANANPANYFKGTMASAGDADYYAFTAAAGDSIFVALDTDPAYDGTADDTVLTLYDTTGAVLVSVHGKNSTTATVGRTSSAANLSARLPYAGGEALEWDAADSGTYYASVTSASGFGQEYALAIAKNCQSGAADLSITSGHSPDTAATGQQLTYTIVVANHGPGSTSATMQDPLPAGLTFVSAAAPAGWSCTTPRPGATGLVSCTGALAASASATFQIVARVNWCTGSSWAASTATVTSAADPHPADNSHTDTTAISDSGACDDGDPCTGPDRCSAGLCGGPALTRPVDVDDTLRLQGAAGSPAILSWSDTPGPFAVYRGIRSGQWVYNHSCLGSSTLGHITDPALPGVGQAYYYLVARRAACGESAPGRNSAGAAIPAGTACP